MEFHEVFKKILEEQGLSIPEAARKCNLTDSTIRSIFDRKQKKIALNVAFKLSKGLGISLERLNGDEEPISSVITNKPTEEEWNLIKKYRALDKHGKEVVDSTLNLEYQRIEQMPHQVEKKPKGKPKEKPEEEDNEDNIIPLPLSWTKASAGEGFYLFEGPDKKLKVLYNNYTRKADFCIRVTGHSMEPKIYDGDIILIRSQPAVDIHDIGLYVINDFGYVKKQGPDRLISINPDYDDVFPNEYDCFRCCGKFIGVLEPEWIVES